MNRFRGLTRDIDQSTSGRSTAAFFDFDGTLIASYSVASFLRRRFVSGRMPPREIIDYLTMLGNYGLYMTDFADVLVEAARTLKGTADSALQEMVQEVFEKDLSADIYPESHALVDAHLAKGHTVVIVSSATQYQVSGVAAELSIDHVLCNRLEVRDGVLTGELIPPVCYGESKADVARDFAAENGIELANSFFYTDGAEDLPLLAAVGHPQAINPDDTLRRRAEREGWPIHEFSSRGLPGPGDVLRTGLVYGALFGSFMAGMPGWLLNRSRRDLTNVAVSTWGDFGSAVAGLDVRTEGEAHLWSHRPAVFIFNHQSATDALILSRLLRRDFAGVAKKEMKSNPLVGLVLGAVGTVFIDRQNHDRAVEALKPAIDSIRSGTSFVIAPEGRRSLGYKLGPFKMGAFHIAMQAGVPIVPIVIANSSDSMPKSSMLIRPARIDVKVLPPVATDDWTTETLHQHVEEIRDMFLRELGQDHDGHVKLRRVK